MKRYIALGALGLAALLPSAFSQEDPVVAAAKKEEAEEHYKSMSAKLERLEETVQQQQQTITKLADELHNLREEIGRVANSSKDAASQESLKGLAEAIKEVDQKRISDNKNVNNHFNEAIAEIQKAFKNIPPPVRPPSTGNPAGPTQVTPSKSNSPASNVEMLQYTVKPGDSLGLLVSKLNKQGVKVTRKQLADANPDIKDWEKIRPGNKIFVPKTQ